MENRMTNINKLNGELETIELKELFDDLARDLKEFYLSPKSKNSLVVNDAFKDYYAIREHHIEVIRRLIHREKRK